MLHAVLLLDAGLEGALVGELAGVALVVEDAELVAGHGHALQAEDLHGVGGAGLGNGVALRIEHGTDASVGHAGDERVADT